MRQQFDRNLITRLVGLMALAFGLITASLLQAQCISVGNDFECSGNVGTTIVVGSTGNNVFRFLSGVTGTISIVSGGGDDALDFQTFTAGINIEMTRTSAQTIVAGLQLVLQDFNIAGEDYTVNGGSGDDVVMGSFGNDTINGGDGDDILNGHEGNDTINGDDGDDVVDGEEGNDILNGGDGDDDVLGYEGADVLNGDDGDDVLYGAEDDDIINGGAGSDTFLSIFGNPMVVDLSAGTATGDGTDTLTGVENVTTGGGKDTLIGDGNDNHLSGGLNDDIIIGGGGDDTLEGNEGNDQIQGGPGSDVIDGGIETDTRTDTVPADCVGDTISNIETDNCVTAPIPPVPGVVGNPTPEICMTARTRVSIENETLLIFSDFGDHNPNGMAITRIPLRILRNPTDDEKARNAVVPLILKASELAPGWSAAVYWNSNHYGFMIYNGQTLFDDTGAICWWF